MWQGFSDFFVFLGWLWENISEIVKMVFTPIRYVFIFLQSIFTKAVEVPVSPESIWSFSTSTIAIFHAIPYWDLLMTAVVSAILISFLIFILKVFLQV